MQATARDDGPGTLLRAVLDARRVVERLSALDGRLKVDAVPGWDTTVTATLPLEPPQGPRSDPLTVLGARELEVLGHLARSAQPAHRRGTAHQREHGEVPRDEHPRQAGGRLARRSRRTRPHLRRRRRLRMISGLWSDCAPRLGDTCPPLLDAGVCRAMKSCGPR